MVSRPVVAIGLDAADHALIDRWSAEGHLPNLARLRQQGRSGTLRHLAFYSDETPWTNFLTGCTPQKTGFWTQFQFAPQSYECSFSPYDFRDYRPFYALAGDRSVCVFDMPHCPVLFPDQQGAQVLGYGAHASMGPLQSTPPSLADELVAKHGEHLGLPIEYKGGWTNPDYLVRMRAALIESVERKTRIALDLLSLDRWDLFLSVFSESHMALHKFWHLSDPDHPLYERWAEPGQDPLRDVYQALDAAIGTIADAVAARKADLMVFSVHGSVANCYDLPSMIFLPELLHRFSFGGRRSLCRTQVGDDRVANGALPEVPSDMPSGDWLRAVWDQKAMTAESIVSLGQWKLGSRLIQRLYPQFYYQPLTWLERRWPKMKAFALPTYGDGYVRINLEGRDARGTVPAGDYDAVCDEITDMLNALRNPRNGEPVVAEIVRTRRDPRSRGAHEPDADLVVVWRQPPADMVSSPAFGTLGPLPFRETGGHRPEGFLIATGDGIAQGEALEAGEVIDLAPTILSRLGVSAPDYMDGRDLLGPAPVSDRKKVGATVDMNDE